MLAVIASLACSSVAVVGALARLRAVGRATTYDPRLLVKQLPWSSGKGALVEFVRVQRSDDQDTPWEGELFRAVSDAPTHEVAQAAANEVLLDVEAALSWGAHLPAACARIALFGAMLAAVLLLAREAKLTMELLDIVALGGCGAMISLKIGSEAKKVAEGRRKAVDTLVDRLMAVVDHPAESKPNPS